MIVKVIPPHHDLHPRISKNSPGCYGAATRSSAVWFQSYASAQHVGSKEPMVRWHHLILQLYWSNIFFDKNGYRLAIASWNRKLPNSQTPVWFLKKTHFPHNKSSPTINVMLALSNSSLSESWRDWKEIHWETPCNKSSCEETSRPGSQCFPSKQKSINSMNTWQNYPPEINIAHEYWWLEEYNPFGKASW